MLRGTEETASASQRGSHLRADFFHYRLEKRLILLILRSPSFHSRHTFLLLKSHSLWYSLWQAEQAKTGMHCRCPFQCCWMVIFRFILAVFCMSPNLSQYCDDLLWPSHCALVRCVGSLSPGNKSPQNKAESSKHVLCPAFEDQHPRAASFGRILLWLAQDATVKAGCGGQPSTKFMYVAIGMGKGVLNARYSLKDTYSVDSPCFQRVSRKVSDRKRQCLL